MFQTQALSLRHLWLLFNPRICKSSLNFLQFKIKIGMATMKSIPCLVVQILHSGKSQQVRTEHQETIYPDKKESENSKSFIAFI